MSEFYPAPSPGSDEALRDLLDNGGVDPDSAYLWLEDARMCLDDYYGTNDGFSLGHALKQTLKAVVALGGKELLKDQEWS